ncbi:MAG: hypothetical protein GYB24_02845 [Rhodobacteraceae bacterium]|nr:hypothetical protein [Paracoccaceae bacterium]
MIRSCLTALGLALGLPAALLAQEYNIQGVARLDILPGYETPSGQMIAARIRLAPGWKTYWRAPGSNGIPPAFDWDGSENLGDVAFHWPEPSVFMKDGERTIGYARELVLPIGITPQKSGAPVSLKGEVLFGVCEDVCIPVKARFAMDVSGNDAGSTKAIKAALRKQPASGASRGIAPVTCNIVPIKGGFKISTTLRSRQPLPAASFPVIEFPGTDVWIEQKDSRIDGHTLTASANLFAYGSTPLMMQRSKVKVTLLGGPRAVELRGCPS